MGPGDVVVRRRSWGIGRARRFVRSVFWTLAVIVGMLPTLAEAQLPLDSYKAAPLPSDGFALSRPQVLRDLEWSASVTLDYARNPLVYKFPQGTPQSIAVVSDQLVAHVGGALGLGSRFTLFGVLPVNVVMSGQNPQGRVHKADGTGLGDFALGGRLRLMDGLRFGLAAEFIARLPSAEASNGKQTYAGDTVGAYEPALIAEARFGRFDVRVRPGYRIRQETHVGNLRFSNQLLYGVGARYRILEQLSVQLEAYGSTTFTIFAGRELSPFEVLLGAKYQPARWTFGAAVGSGLSPGYGAPDVRAVATVGFASAAGTP